MLWPLRTQGLEMTEFSSTSPDGHFSRKKSEVTLNQESSQETLVGASPRGDINHKKSEVVMNIKEVPEAFQDHHVPSTIHPYCHAQASIHAAPLLRSGEGRDRASVLFLVGAIIVEFVVWGFPLNYGVFQRSFVEDPRFAHSSWVNSIGLINMGAAYGLAPLGIILPVRYKDSRSWMMLAGTITCIVSTAISSKASLVWHLILLQGVIYSFGFLLLYYPMIAMLNEHFIERRGMAYGVMSALGATSGIALPYIFEGGLSRYGSAITLQAVAAGIAVTTLPALFLLRPGLADQKLTNMTCKWSLLKTPKFWVLTWSNVFQGAFFFLPGMILPTYASALGLSHAQGNLVVVIQCIFAVISQLVMAAISDRYARVPVFVSTLGSATVVFGLWLMSSYFPDAAHGLLLAFAAGFGFFAGGYSVYYGVFLAMLSPHQDTGLYMLAIFDFQRGLGVAISGPLYSLLLTSNSSPADYRELILCTGVAMALSSLAILGWTFPEPGQLPINDAEADVPTVVVEDGSVASRLGQPYIIIVDCEGNPVQKTDAELEARQAKLARAVARKAEAKAKAEKTQATRDLEDLRWRQRGAAAGGFFRLRELEGYDSNPAALRGEVPAKQIGVYYGP